MMQRCTPKQQRLKESTLGLPDPLKTALEALSGLTLDDVIVHFHAPEPAQIHALAYTQGLEIYLGPGQEHYLAHEAWHVVQQKQGRVQPTRLAGGLAINDDERLEREADMMGLWALRGEMPEMPLAFNTRSGRAGVIPAVIQGKFLTPVGTVLADGKAKVLMEKFYARYAQELKRKYGLDKDAIDEALSLIREQDAYEVQLKDTEGGLYSEENLGQVYKTVCDILVLPHDWKQIFGMDLPKAVESTIKVEVLKQALVAGYRVFDAAEAYQTLPLLRKAAAEAKVKMESLTLIYKLRPENQEEEDQSPFPKRLLAGVRIAPEASLVLMLHELATSDERTKTCLFDLSTIQAEKIANVLGFGLSNVTLEELRGLHILKEKDITVKIGYVQNRFSPYVQDEGVRDYCERLNIRYIGYGLFGSLGQGVCIQSKCLPAESLLALQDPRVLTLAKKQDINPAQLLLAWANQKGICTITTSRNHAKENLSARSLFLNKETVTQLDGFFTFNEATTRSDYSKEAGVAELYKAQRDPTTWFILDLLLATANIKALFGRMVADIQQRHPGYADDEARWKRPMRNFVYNLVRLVARVQEQVVLEAALDLGSWDRRVSQTFEQLARDITAQGPLWKLYEWSQQDYMESGGASEALTILSQQYGTNQMTLTADLFATSFTHSIGNGGGQLLPGNFEDLLQAGQVGLGTVYYSSDSPNTWYRLVSADAKQDRFVLERIR